MSVAESLRDRQGDNEDGDLEQRSTGVVGDGTRCVKVAIAVHMSSW